MRVRLLAAALTLAIFAVAARRLHGLTGLAEGLSKDCKGAERLNTAFALRTCNMPKAAPNWPSANTRALIAGKYDRLFQQTSKLFGDELAYRMILRAVLGNVDATD